MNGLTVPRRGYLVARWKRAAAILATVGLAAAVVKLGLKPLPADQSPLKLRLDFANSGAPLPRSPNDQMEQTPQGLVLSSIRPAVSVTVFGRQVKGLGRARVRLNVQQPSEGRIRLIIEPRSGAQQTLIFPFHSRGGGVFEDIVVPLAFNGAPDDVIKEVGLLPSVIPQTAVVASMVLEPDAPFLETVAKELVSPLPGELTALKGTSINWLPPFVMNGRSAWMVLMPIMLLAGTIARLTSGNTRTLVVIRRYAWGTLGAVWGLGFALMMYHQAVAVVADTKTYGGLNRDDAYAVIDMIPLSQDMREVAKLISPHTFVEFSVVGDQAPEQVLGFWKRRATYYLLPIQVRPSASVKVEYFVGAHPSCAQVEPQKVLLHEAARFCLFGTQE